MVTLGVKSLLEEVCGRVLLVQLLFALLTPVGILNLQSEYVVNAFFPVIHVRPDAMVVQEHA